MARVDDVVVRPGLRARLYRDDLGSPNCPVVVFAHGGGWAMGSLDTHDGLCRYLARHSRAAVLSVDYRLAPEHPYPAALDDLRAAVEWVARQAHRYGLDPSRVIVAGDSAGGHLAAAVATEPHNVEVVGQVLLYPVLSLRTSTASYSRIQQGFPLTAASMQWFIDLYLARTDANPGARDLNPGYHAHPLPTFLCTVGHDPLCDDGLSYADALAQAGASRIEHVHLPQHAHGVFTSAGVVSTGQRVLAQAATFVAHLCAPAGPTTVGR